MRTFHLWLDFNFSLMVNILKSQLMLRTVYLKQTVDNNAAIFHLENIFFFFVKWDPDRPFIGLCSFLAFFYQSYGKIDGLTVNRTLGTGLIVWDCLSVPIVWDCLSVPSWQFTLPTTRSLVFWARGFTALLLACLWTSIACSHLLSKYEVRLSHVCDSHLTHGSTHMQSLAFIRGSNYRHLKGNSFVVVTSLAWNARFLPMAPI